MIRSDNTGCDVLLRALGGPSIVMAHLQQLGVSGLRVDRTEIAIAMDSLKAARPSALVRADRASPEQLEDSLTPAEQALMVHSYEDDPRDTGTPHALVELLSRFQLEDRLSRESAALLRSLMQRARPVQLALKLPPNTPSLHKTGTGWGSANDIGIVTLPNGQHLMLAILVSHAQNLSLEAADALIADAGRAVYDRVSGELERSTGVSPSLRAGHF